MSNQSKRNERYSFTLEQLEDWNAKSLTPDDLFYYIQTKAETTPPDTFSREEAIFFAIEYHLHKIRDHGDLNEHDINDAEDFLSTYKPLLNKENKK